MLPRLDFPFTETDTPALRARIARDLSLISQRCALADKHLDALVLTGGFSRGEGTARDDAPLNDYDLVAVRSRPGGARAYRALSEALTAQLGIHVDLLTVARARLPHVGAKLFWLDLRLRGRIILGDERVLSELRPLHATDITRREVARLLGNRAAGLLLATTSAPPATATGREAEAGGKVGGATESLETPRGRGAAEVAMSDLQSTKAVLAAMDARLLARGVYAAQVRDRLWLSTHEPDYDIFKKAVEWKLGGSSPLLGDDWWSAARGALVRAVDETGSERASDSWQERVFGLFKARTLSWNPSSEIRKRAWTLLRECNQTIAADAEWPSVTRSFFAARAKTLQ